MVAKPVSHSRNIAIWESLWVQYLWHPRANLGLATTEDEFRRGKIIREEGRRDETKEEGWAWRSLAFTTYLFLTEIRYPGEN